MSVDAKQLLVLGDSLSAAYNMDIKKGWVYLLGNKLGRAHRVANASVSGMTSSGGLKLLPEQLQRVKPDIVVIELGANDGLRGYPLNIIERNLSELIRLSQQAGAKVLLTEIKVPPNYGMRYSNAFNGIYSRLASKYRITLIPFFLEPYVSNPRMMQKDGIHPLPITQPGIRDQIYKALKKYL